METLVDRTGASRETRERVKVILHTLSGELSVKEGYERIGVGRTRFQDLRRRMLGFAADGLEERAAGRPRLAHLDATHEEQRLAGRVEELERHVLELETELEIACSDAAAAVRARLAARGARQ